MSTVKNVIQEIYKFDFSKTSLLDKYEIISAEFTNNFSLRDIDRGYSVIPFGYVKGLFYKASEGAIFNSPKYQPEVVSFGVAINGLKKGHFYRITVTAKNTRKYSMFSDDVTDDRTLVIKNAYKEILINKDFSDDLEYVNVSSIFKAESVEDRLSVSMGKISLQNVLIEEIEIVSEEAAPVEQDEENTDISYTTGKEQMVAYGIFSMGIPESLNRRREIHRSSGKGLMLFYDTVENVYTIERDNENDLVNDNLGNSNVVIELVTTKMINSGVFTHYEILEVSNEASPNTLRHGYIKFRFMNGTDQVKFDDIRSRLFIRATKLF